MTATDPYLDGVYGWWHLSEPSPELLAAESNGWLTEKGTAIEIGCGLGIEVDLALELPGLPTDGGACWFWRSDEDATRADQPPVPQWTRPARPPWRPSAGDLLEGDKRAAAESMSQALFDAWPVCRGSHGREKGPSRSG